MKPKKLSIKQLVILWISSELSHGRDRVKNSDMQRVRNWAIDKYNIYHNASSYERMFRKIRSDTSGTPFVGFDLMKSTHSHDVTENEWRVRKGQNQQGLF